MRSTKEEEARLLQRRIAMFDKRAHNNKLSFTSTALFQIMQEDEETSSPDAQGFFNRLRQVIVDAHRNLKTVNDIPFDASQSQIQTFARQSQPISESQNPYDISANALFQQEERSYEKGVLFAKILPVLWGASYQDIYQDKSAIPFFIATAQTIQAEGIILLINTLNPGRDAKYSVGGGGIGSGSVAFYIWISPSELRVQWHNKSSRIFDTYALETSIIKFSWITEVKIDRATKSGSLSYTYDFTEAIDDIIQSYDELLYREQVRDAVLADPAKHANIVLMIENIRNSLNLDISNEFCQSLKPYYRGLPEPNGYPYLNLVTLIEEFAKKFGDTETLREKTKIYRLLHTPGGRQRGGNLQKRVTRRNPSQKRKKYRQTFSRSRK
jgi:hypothetical protein